MHTLAQTIVRGDRWEQPFRLDLPDLDWSGATFRAHVRTEPDGDLLASADVATTTPATGRCDGSLTLAPEVTQDLPAKCVLELEVSKPSVEFGPHTLFRVILTVDPDYTHD
jgi:hypothetical protein